MLNNLDNLENAPAMTRAALAFHGCLPTGWRLTSQDSGDYVLLSHKSGIAIGIMWDDGAAMWVGYGPGCYAHAVGEWTGESLFLNALLNLALDEYC